MADPGAQGGADAAGGGVPADVVLVVDAANVVGARPDGWWRDRAGAARRLLGRLEGLPGLDVEGPDGATARVVAVAVVLEGRARAACEGAREPAPGLEVLLAGASGDDAVVELVGHLRQELGEHDAEVVVVTADRGLRARVPVRSWGPGWLRDLIDECGA